jgi:hypothetical protein
VYTGFEFGRVKLDFSSVLDLLDVIITGPYEEQRRVQGIPFISSSNQKIHCLTTRARNGLATCNHVGEYEVVINKNDRNIVELGVNLPWW